MNKLLVATDFSPTARAALRFARELAACTSAQLELVTVSRDPRADTWVTLSGNQDAHSEGVTTAARAELERLSDDVLSKEGMADVPVHVRVGEVAQSVLSVADDVDADLIVCGATGTTRLQALFFGATANRLVRQSTLPVLIVPDTDEDVSIDAILAPIDMSETSKSSLRHAASIAQACSAKLVVLHAAIAPPSRNDPFIGHLARNPKIWRAEIDAAIEAFLADALPGVTPDSILVRTERPAEAILAAAQESGADLICMGTHGRSGIARFQLGNTAERILRRAPCPVLTVH